MSKYLFVALQYLLPQVFLSRLIGSIARSELAWIRRPLIGGFMDGFKPDLRDAVQPNPLAYPSFNAFFTRALRADARPQATDLRAITSPVDGQISALGSIEAGQLVQAKGHTFTLRALLASNDALVAGLSDGLFMTIYLAPFNYHRIHMALAGQLTSARYVPGRLFSVNHATASMVPGLFARNERVILEFAGVLGPYALVMVGALFVGSMGTVWHGDIPPQRRRRHGSGYLPLPLPLDPPHHPAALVRGAELGRFNMGSTVILLLPPHTCAWDPALQPGTALRVGQAIGSLALQ